MQRHGPCMLYILQRVPLTKTTSSGIHPAAQTAANKAAVRPGIAAEAAADLTSPSSSLRLAGLAIFACKQSAGRLQNKPLRCIIYSQRAILPSR